MSLNPIAIFETSARFVISKAYERIPNLLPTKGPAIQPGVMSFLLETAKEFGSPTLTDPRDIQRIWFLRPIEYMQTSLIVSMRKFYYYASASSNKQDYIERAALGVRNLAKEKIADKDVHSRTLELKAREIFREAIQDSSFNYTTLATYIGTGIATSVLSWGARYYIASLIYPDIPYLSTAATLATLYGWTMCITPNVRSELLNVKALSLPEFSDIYDEDMHDKVSAEAQRIFKDDDVGTFKESRGDIHLPKATKIKTPFPPLPTSALAPATAAPKPKKSAAPPAVAASALAPVDLPDPLLVSVDNPLSDSGLEGQWQALNRQLSPIKKSHGEDSVQYLRHYANMDKLKAQIFRSQKKFEDFVKYEIRHIDKEKKALEGERKPTASFLDEQLKAIQVRLQKAEGDFALQGALGRVKDHITSLKPAANLLVVSPAKPPAPTSRHTMDSDDD